MEKAWRISVSHATLSEMIEFAMGVAAFLFLCWVAIQGIALLCSIFGAITENKEGRQLIAIGVPLLLLWIALVMWK